MITSRIHLGVAGLFLLTASLDRPGALTGDPWIALGIGGILTIMTGVLLTRRSLPREVAWPSTLLCLLVLLRAATTWFSLDPYRSQTNLCGWVLALSLYLIVLTGIESLADWRLFTATLTGIVLVLSIWAFLSYSPGGPVATFESPDSFAFLPLTAILLCVGLLQGRGDWLCWLAGGLFLLTFLLVGGRTATGALLAGALALVWVYRVRLTPPEARPGSPGGGVLLLGLLVLAIFLVFVRPQLPSLSHTIGDADAERLRWRRDILWQSVTLVPSRPMTGSGPGSFSLAFQEVPGQEPDAKPATSPQNDLIESVVETGIPGAILWGLVLVTTFFLTYTRALEVVDPALPPDWSSLGALGALTSASVFSLLFSVISLPATLLWMVTVLALAARSGRCTEPALGSRRAALLVGMLLSLAGLWVLSFSWRSVLASGEVERGTRATQSLLLEEALKELDQATRHAPDWWRAHYEKARALRLLAAESGDPAGLKQAIEELEQAHRCSPRELSVLALLGSVHLEASDPARAAEIYTLGARWAPASLGFKRGVLNARLQQGELEQALRVALELYGAGGDKPASVVLLALTTRDQSAAVRLLRQAELSQAGLMDLLQATESRARQVGLSQIVAPLYSVWLEKHPDDWSIQLRQARLLIDGGLENEGFMKVAELKREVPADDPAAVEVLCSWAELVRARGQSAEARTDLEKRLREDSEQTPVRRLLTRILIEDGESDKALTLIDEGLLTDPNDPELLVLKARILLDRGALDAALEYASLVLAAQPNNHEAAEIRQKAMKGISSP